jgi:DNA-binding response OmpR family regulator
MGEKRILVAEDGGPLRAALERMLGSAGYAVESVNNGDAALERLLDDTEPPADVLLVDINLPGRSGPEVIAAAREALSEPPACVLMSGSLVDATAAGDTCAAILVKPFGAEELLQAVDAALGS